MFDCIFSKWNQTFAWLPVESIIHDRQQEYYNAINISNDAGKSTAFIEFMLSAIEASLIDATEMSDDMSDEKTDKKALRLKKIEQFLQTHEYIMNADVRGLCGVSAATANRILAGLTETGVLKKYHINGYWKYKSAKNKLCESSGSYVKSAKNLFRSPATKETNKPK